MKEAIDLHNQADQLIYQTEKQIDEFKEKLDSETVSKLNDAKDKLSETNKGTDLDSIKADIENLNKIWSSATEKMYQESSENADPATSQEEGASSGAKSDDAEIKDADFEVVDDSEEKS